MSHAATLSSSAKHKGIAINFLGIIDPRVDPGVPGGRELVALAYNATLEQPELASVDALADTLGEASAVSAIEIAGAFAMINRVMHATGSHVPIRRLDAARSALEQLAAMDFPNADLVEHRSKRATRKLRKIVRRLGK